MSKLLVKLLIIFMIGLVFHDYFTKQCDIFQTHNIDFNKEHSAHQILHLTTLELEKFEPIFIPFLDNFLFEYKDLSSQFIYHLSPPPPKLSLS